MHESLGETVRRRLVGQYERQAGRVLVAVHVPRQQRRARLCCFVQEPCEL